MSDAQVIWYGPQVTERVKGTTARRVDMAARALRDLIRVKLSRSQPVKIYGKKAGRSRHGLAPSQPGEFPKKVTGNLRRNVQAEFDPVKIESRVGTNVKYGKFLELGTKNMARRPWLSMGLQIAAPMMRAILATGVAPGGGVRPDAPGPGAAEAAGGAGAGGGGGAG